MVFPKHSLSIAAILSIVSKSYQFNCKIKSFKICFIFVFPVPPSWWHTGRGPVSVHPQNQATSCGQSCRVLSPNLWMQSPSGFYRRLCGRCSPTAQHLPSCCRAPTGARSCPKAAPGRAEDSIFLTLTPIVCSLYLQKQI